MEQRELAQRLGVSVSSIANWERGRNRPRGSMLRDLARALGKPLSYFTGDPASDAGPQPALDMEPPVIRPLPAFPGIRKLLEDPDMCATLGVTAADRELLESYSGEAGPRTPAEAFSLLQVLRQMSASRI